MKKLLPLFILLFHVAVNGFSQCDFSNYADTNIFYFDTTDANNIWQVGKSGKSICNGYSNPVVITDTLNSYPAKDTSFFILKIKSDSCLLSCNTVLNFRQSYNLDTLKDKGYIDVSYDEGKNWFLLQDYLSENLKNPNIAGIHGWWVSDTANPITGKSKGWINRSFYWVWYKGMGLEEENVLKSSMYIKWRPDTLLYVRFTLISDSINTSKDGWAIDSIYLTHPPMLCGRLQSHKSEISISPNPFHTSARISLPESLLADRYDIMNETGAIVKSESITTPEFEISRNNLSDGLYFLKIFTRDGDVLIEKLIIQ